MMRLFNQRNPDVRRAMRLSGTLLLMLISTEVFSQVPEVAFVQREVIKVKDKQTDASLYPLPLSQKAVNRDYIDGAGRLIQSIGLGASQGQNDLIQPYVYDNLGRQSMSYLPYAGQATDAQGRYRTDALTAQAAFYSNGTGDKIADDGSPFSQKIFEFSPLQRLVNWGQAGFGFQPYAGHSKSAVYRYNDATDGSIVLYSPDGTKLGNYAASALSVTDVTDEDGGRSMVFTDKTGRDILKRRYANTVVGSTPVTWFDTYYVYNEAGMLLYIIPPKAVSVLAANTGYTLSTTAVASLIYKYQYDEKGRVSQKTLPGGSVMSMIYDPLDRLVLMQNAKLKLLGQWNYVKYDAMNRAISQGVYTNSATPAAMQATVSALDYSTNWYESRGVSSSDGYYSNNCFPNATGTITPLAYIYYDNYDLDSDGTANFTYSNQGFGTDEPVPIANNRGKLTITRSRTVGPGLGNLWLTSVSFYDKYGRVIQTQSDNQLNTALSDIRTTVFDFRGVPQKVKEVKAVNTASPVTTTVLTSMTYDHVNRIKAVDQQYNSSSTVLHVAAYIYNELGQLVDKQLHQPAGGTTWLQSVDFRYNIRGQLTSINNSKLNVDPNTNDDTNDVFGMELLYNLQDGNLGNDALYRGNISAVKWMSLNATGVKGYERSFKYSYDLLNRYTGSAYAERTTTGTSNFDNNVGGFNENEIKYDENGNIKALKRNSSTPGTNSNIQVDDLNYSYDDNNLNQLTKVTDGIGANYTSYGFRNLKGASASATYTYETGTGNLIADPYKGLSLTYNLLNLSEQVTIAAGKYIDYTYSAGGQLLRKRVTDGSTVKITDYIGGFVYNSTAAAAAAVLNYFSRPEGRVRNNSGTLVQEYTINDQQGNARVSFDNSGAGGTAKVIQESSFYGFGLQLKNSLVALPTVPNKELYNGGSEWQNDYTNDLPDYYQTPLRNYDAALGRFVAMDPEPDATEELSVYQYANNNPVLNNDPMGNMATGASVNQSGSVQYAMYKAQVWGDLGRELDQATFEFFNPAYQITGQADFGYLTSSSGMYAMSDVMAIAAANARNKLAETDKGKTTSVYVNQQGEIISSYSHDGGDGKVHYYNAHRKYEPGHISTVAEGEISEKEALERINSYNSANQGSFNFPPFDWYGNYSKLNAFVGGQVFFMDQWKSTGRFQMAAESFKAMKVVGIAGAIAGTTMDGIGVYNYYHPTSSNVNSRVSPNKFGINAGMAGLGLWGGLPGEGTAAWYFGIDAFYPGGVPGFGKALISEPIGYVVITGSL